MIFSPKFNSTPQSSVLGVSIEMDSSFATITNPYISARKLIKSQSVILYCVILSCLTLIVPIFADKPFWEIISLMTSASVLSLYVEYLGTIVIC